MRTRICMTVIAFFPKTWAWLSEAYNHGSVIIVSDYHSAQGWLIAGSLALLGLSFTAFSTLNRIKDKVYGDPRFKKRIQRLRAIELDIDPFVQYEQLLKTYDRARLMAGASACFQITLGWLPWSPIGIVGFGLMIISVLYVLRVAYLFSKNLREEVRLDRELWNQDRRGTEERSDPLDADEPPGMSQHFTQLTT